MRLLPVIALAWGCASDHQVTNLCGHAEDGFDIEDVSVLQDAQSAPRMHDAVILDFDAELPADAAWRVKAVEIMPMLPQRQFDAVPGGQRVVVEVWEGDDPTATEPWIVGQEFDKDALEWVDTTLEDPYTAVPEQRYAWWSFDFSGEIPTSGMAGQTYTVGVAWANDGEPPMGYSNFNRPCDLNWTDYGDGNGWVLNGDTSGDECSWPMFRVEIEVLQEQASCDEGSVIVE